MNPRDYQLAAHDSLFREWGHAPWWDGERETSQKTLLNTPTSSGKTIMAALIARTVVEEIKGRFLFVADREELLQQPVKKFYEACGIIASIERGSERASMMSDYVVSSVQTLSRENRLARFPRNHFTHILDDECHRNTEKRQVIHEHFPDAKVCGLTATAMRKGLANLSKWYQTVAFELQTFDMMDEGYITPIKVLTMPLSVDISEVKQKDGDFDKGQLDTILEPYYRAVAAAIKEHAGKRTILAFLPLISSSVAFVRVLNEEGISAKHCDGSMRDRTSILEEFERGDFQVLSNSQVFSTGVDFIRCDCLLNLSPTRSMVEYRQRAGRIMRLIPGTIDPPPDRITLPTPALRRAAIAACSKPDCLILDLLWQTSKIGLVGPASLIAGSEEEEKAIAEKVKKQRDPEELQEIRRFVQREREERLRRALEAEAAKATEASQRKATLKDARQLVLDLGDPKISEYEPVMPWETRGATPQQKERLARLGFDGDGVAFGLASKLLDSVASREITGMAPVEAFAALRGAGFEHPEQITLNHAINVLRFDFPMTFGKKYHGLPLSRVPRTFWLWLMYDKKPAAAASRRVVQEKHPAVWRFMTKIVFPAPEPAPEPQAELAL